MPPTRTPSWISAWANIDVKAAVGAEDQVAILEKLNAQAAEGVLYIDAAQAAALPKAAYSTIFVGDTDAFANLGSFAGIAETTGAFAAANKGDNAFVITGTDFNADSLVSTIAHEAGHLMGTGCARPDKIDSNACLAITGFTPPGIYYILEGYFCN